MVSGGVDKIQRSRAQTAGGAEMITALNRVLWKSASTFEGPLSQNDLRVLIALIEDSGRHGSPVSWSRVTFRGSSFGVAQCSPGCRIPARAVMSSGLEEDEILLDYPGEDDVNVGPKWKKRVKSAGLIVPRVASDWAHSPMTMALPCPSGRPKRGAAVPSRPLSSFVRLMMGAAERLRKVVVGPALPIEPIRLVNWESGTVIPEGFVSVGGVKVPRSAAQSPKMPPTRKVTRWLRGFPQGYARAGEMTERLSRAAVSSDGLLPLVGGDNFYVSLVMA
ncbi:hypothetical protein CORC01_13685 [Colletotrichum orchidophilum]|uniref:Uncharacterized protein n=1 Tax=Colletotrichum orchidophilum TaxID=1209926 RepID=A0A1G4APA5_9PEZI|nr:uncharacterized protein CORC01_13685 [Colletotrichum orchidophilum]OHE91004.1 hypothetical protein CORC01_13685 [Colletotrichum orchidophilum]